MTKISNTCRLKFDNNKVILAIRKSISHILFSTIGLAILGSIILYNSIGIDSTEGKFLILFFTISSIQFLCLIGLKEESIIDLNRKCVLRKKKIFNICFKTINTNWDDPYFFKYIINYDTYKNITAIWLVTANPQTNKNYQLIKFFDKSSFIKFQELFNSQFPTNKILEWHD
jgi:hypothetical protein